MKLSQRALDIQASPIRKLMPHAVAARQRGLKVYQLNIGQPDIPTPQPMLDAYHSFSEKVLAYGPSQGLDPYRKGLVDYYARQNIPLKDNQIIVTTAGSEAVTFAMMVVAEAGDEIIVPEPFYTNYNGFATMAGITIRPLLTLAETGFQLPGDEAIEALITPKTKAIMICNPGNPTGTVYSREDIFRLGGLAKKHGLFVISDEVYREFIYEGRQHTSILHVPGLEEHAVMVDSVSKRYSACGARIGCIVSRNQALMDATLKFAQARLCPPTVDQLAALACVPLGDEFFRPLIAEYQARREIVYNALMEIPGVVCVKPQGAFYILVKLPVDDCEKFIVWMLDEFQIDGETVMGAPGEGFYATPGLGRNEMRLAYVLNEAELRKAMHIFSRGFEEYKKLKA
ncbi:MAG TPA: pyridoxal phosphate-dependent aminotransferase [Candidatus Syntrophosphaera sp.]|jgi:aspartate aminotransferase|nr:pyridoxal phosphate-dependent aminotransferase [Candidatus Cloacimonadota bacterium]OQB92638.1 MAG: Aspartate aminotransferase [Candidatus Cloacimonetes bacterium ADurb.Bin117]HOH48142.1 pyridoxal phosphate-dependent aminotransferase [Candidatus Syntrophosphaera sp.]HPB42804.1 pyridoxal phosphate-dependent aminotransferase [Candidatus Syntrophosphaera sp.]HQO67430.1 pyridoxal phosphate-dependent aminotransferase [Candidatus Syntrophosphaera sp.]